MGINASYDKALSRKQCAVKEKQARFFLNKLTSEQLKFGELWVAAWKRIELGDEIRVWKFCYLLHYLLFHGFDSCRGKMTVDRKNDLKKLGNGSGSLVQKYVEFLLVKIEMHEKCPNISGNWDITFADFEEFIGGHRDSSGVINTIVEVLQRSVDLEEAVLKFLKGKKIYSSISMSKEGKCRLIPFALCFEESIYIRDLCHHVIFKPQLAAHVQLLKTIDEKLSNECQPGQFNIIFESLPRKLQERYRRKTYETGPESGKTVYFFCVFT